MMSVLRWRGIGRRSWLLSGLVGGIRLLVGLLRRLGLRCRVRIIWRLLGGLRTFFVWEFVMSDVRVSWVM